ncbi:MAG: L-histidine N(alpha)-methyltransferase [Cyanobacteria bacterium J06636_27]
MQLKGSQILPVQVDFSTTESLSDLKKLLYRLVGDTPVLFSLLGNTLANFEKDTQVLQTVSKLMRSEDKFLIEVAATEDLSSKALQDTVNEYDNSKSFKEFVTSALLQYTDLDIDLNSVFFESSTERSDKAILLKAIYRNITGNQDKVMLLDRSTINFLDQDTIRLYLTRKYTRSGIESVISESKLSIIDRINTLSDSNHRNKFGMDLILLTSNETIIDEQNSSLASAVWNN